MLEFKTNTALTAAKKVIGFSLETSCNSVSTLAQMLESICILAEHMGPRRYREEQMIERMERDQPSSIASLVYYTENLAMCGVNIVISPAILSYKVLATCNSLVNRIISR